MTKIYLIDDDNRRYPRYLKLVERLREEGLNVQAGWGTSEAEIKASSYDAEKILSALSEDESICLVDLMFDGSYEGTYEELRQLAEKRELHEALGRFEQWRNDWGRLRDEEQLGFLIVALSIELRTKTTIVSTRLHMDSVGRLQNLGLTHQAFPVIAGVEDESNMSTGDRETLETRFQRLLGVIRGHLNPLMDIKSRTADWFTETCPDVPHDWNDIVKKRAKVAHRERIQEVFPWMPNEWWAEEHAYLLHENLKCFCGQNASWMYKRGVGPKRFNLGAAFLLVLHSVEMSEPGWVRRSLNDEYETLRFQGFCDPGSSALVNTQDKDMSYQTIRSLQMLIDKIIVNKETGRIAVRQLDLDPKNRMLTIALDWSTGAVVQKIIEKIESGILKEIRQKELRTGEPDKVFSDHAELDTTSVSDLYLRYLLQSQLGTNRAGSPGVVQFDGDSKKNELVLASIGR